MIGEGAPATAHEADNVRFFLPQRLHRVLDRLPWHLPLALWEDQGVMIIPVKSGLSRHLVRFVEVKNKRFAIKETTLHSAQREYRSYVELTRIGIPTLIPAGVIARHDGIDVVDTPIGRQHQTRETGYLVTELMEKVVPDSFLYRRGFSRQNRNRIWEAVITLFVQLHSNGVYWGDASLANMLIHFTSESVPELGARTRLRAILADAETVEIRPSITQSLRLADVEFFLESMHWTEADLQASGIIREPVLSQEEHRFFLERYRDRYAVEQEQRSFELITHIDVDTLLGNFDAKGYGQTLLQHINEHKWYLSERKKKEIPLVDAAEDWYKNVFKPVCRIFQEYGMLEFFPDKTASSLYVEIMEHKYFMSQQEKRDVGLVAAVEHYALGYATCKPVNVSVNTIVDALTRLFRKKIRTASSIYLS